MARRLKKATPSAVYKALRKKFGARSTYAKKDGQEVIFSTKDEAEAYKVDRIRVSNKYAPDDVALYEGMTAEEIENDKNVTASTFSVKTIDKKGNINTVLD